MSEALLLEVMEVTGVPVLPVLLRWLEENISLLAALELAPSLFDAMLCHVSQTSSA
jgi:hypothetical protein